MDVVKVIKNKSLWKNKLLILLILVAIVGAAIGYSYQSMPTINRGQLIIDAVKQGDLDVTVSGFGKLISAKQQLITATSSAVVKDIILKPGAKVNSDSVIVQLENIELELQIDNAKQEINQAKANLRQLKLNNQREKLRELSSLTELIAKYEAAALKMAAEEKLVDRGIVSKITFQQTVLEKNQLNQRVDILTERIEQLNLVHLESVNIQLEAVKQKEVKLNIAQSRVDKLTIVAGFEGVLQRLSVELGQSLSVGQEIALIGSTTELIAQIRVPQNQAQLIDVGDIATVSTRRDDISGIVSRISPVVENNTVEVDISLPDELPKSARPQLNIDSKIVTESLANINYIKRPTGVKPYTEVSLYSIQGEMNTAQLKKIRFGKVIGHDLEILSGAVLGEKLIISDISSFQSNNGQISIN